MIDQRTSRRGLMTFGAIAVASDAAYAMAGSPNGHTPSQDVMRKHEARYGVVIAYEDEWFGAPWLDGEPIVLLHGVAESHVAWQQWLPVLSGRFRVIRPDLPGFGQSPLPAS